MRSSKVYEPELLAEWEKCLDEGMAYKHVAEIFHVAKRTVAKHFPGRGWTPEQISDHANLVRHTNKKIRRLNVMC